MDVEANLRVYLGARRSTDRYSSFDYCFNHFQGHRDKADDLSSAEGMELSCLHLAFYLASWGMLRGSSVLLQRSVKHYAPLIEAIASSPDEVWDTDANGYTLDAIELVLSTARQIRVALPEGASDILVSKIMLGVFGCVPAFDTYFRKGFGVSTFGRRSLRMIGDFYESNSEVIDRHLVPTLDFATGNPTDVRYTRAKVIDMIFFVEGGYRSTTAVP